MKKAVLFICLWFALILIPLSIANLYSNHLYDEFIAKESDCSKLILNDAKKIHESCFVENIIEKSRSEISVSQIEVVDAYKRADNFNLVLLLVLVVSFVLGGIISWLFVYIFCARKA